MPTLPLNCINALVTRPAEPAEQLAVCIREQGGKALVMPMLALVPLPETQSMRDRVLNLDLYDNIIVISRQAARSGMTLLENYWPQLPQNLHWFAIGEATRQTLAQFDVLAFCSQQGSDSESLLALECFRSITGQRILLIKGKGGRNYLEHTLQQRGAVVDVLPVYQRHRPDYNPNDVRQRLAEHDINVILTGSGETVQHLHHYLPEHMIKQCRLVTPGERVARQARALGFKHVVTASGADHGAMLSVLKTINGETFL